MLTHSMALVSCLSGIFGQSAGSYGGRFGPVTLSFILFTVMIFYIAFTWRKDLNAPKFMLTNFISSWFQCIKTARSNKEITSVLLISTFTESSIIIFTFYWAPWLTTILVESELFPTFPFPLIFSTYVASSMFGAYLYQILVPSLGNGNIFQMVLVGSSLAYFLGSVFQTSFMVYSSSIFIQFLVGAYWPCIGFSRGRFISQEFRSVTLNFTR